MTNRYNKLLLNWKGPDTGKNYPVGVLHKENERYIFYYNKEILPEAEEDGFVPFIGLSDVNVIYASKKMFSVFERRLPNTTRNDFKTFLDEHNLEHSNDVCWDYFCITKGKLATDSLSFVVPVVFEKNMLYLSCEVAGWSHTMKNNRDLSQKDELTVRIDPKNEHDKYAVEFLDHQNNNTRVGFIPKPFNLLFYRLIERKMDVCSKVYHVNKDDRRPHVIVFAMQVSRETALNEKDLQYLIDYH